MQFLILSRTELEITAETATEVKELIKHFRLDPFEHAEAYALGRMVYVKKADGRDNPGFFEVETHLDERWLAPYMVRLKAITGYAGPLPEIDNFPVTKYDWLLHHIHQPTFAKLDADGLTVKGIQWSQDWDGKPAEVRAVQYFAECVREDMGARKTEPEYISVGNGSLLKPNPNYLKRHAPHPAAANARAFGALLGWWLETHASNKQCKVVEKALACHRTVCKNDTLGQWLLRSYDQGWRVDWKSPLISFDEWQKMV